MSILAALGGIFGVAAVALLFDLVCYTISARRRERERQQQIARYLASFHPDYDERDFE